MSSTQLDTACSVARIEVKNKFLVCKICASNMPKYHIINNLGAVRNLSYLELVSYACTQTYFLLAFDFVLLVYDCGLGSL
jgi:hypothetical protein